MATLAGGCFWCLEAVFQPLRGVVRVVSGYTGGRVPNPSYQAVCTGMTGHAEAVEITFDPAVLPYRELLELFFAFHDPTTLNRQGPDDGTRDGAYGHRTDFGGDIFQKHELFWDRSPLKYVQNVTTPILVLHSDNDYRVPLEQGEQWFRALRHFGKTAELVIFPRENHNLTRTGEPRHLVESLDWQLYWFTRYLEGKADAIPPDRR